MYAQQPLFSVEEMSVPGIRISTTLSPMQDAKGYLSPVFIPKTGKNSPTSPPGIPGGVLDSSLHSDYQTFGAHSLATGFETDNSISIVYSDHFRLLEKENIFNTAFPFWYPQTWRTNKVKIKQKLKKKTIKPKT